MLFVWFTQSHWMGEHRWQVCVVPSVWEAGVWRCCLGCGQVSKRHPSVSAFIPISACCNCCLEPAFFAGRGVVLLI